MNNGHVVKRVSKTVKTVQKPKKCYVRKYHKRQYSLHLSKDMPTQTEDIKPPRIRIKIIKTKRTR